MNGISLVSVNIERSKHLDLVVPFLREREADIACIQECMERDIPFLKETVGEHVLFVPLCIFAQRADEEEGLYGQAIFSRYPFITNWSQYYAGVHDPLSTFSDDKKASIERLAKAVCGVEFEKEGIQYQIANTHFTWSKDGESDERQRTDLQALFRILDMHGEFAILGDFNAPRGRTTWDTIAAKYKDNIPSQYTSSIDPVLHRAAPLPYVVDGLFTTPAYVASQVELISGVSDHCAVVAQITKTTS